MNLSPRRSAYDYFPNGAPPPPPGYSYVLIPHHLNVVDIPHSPLSPIPIQHTLPLSLPLTPLSLPQSPVPFMLTPISPAMSPIGARYLPPPSWNVSPIRTVSKQKKFESRKYPPVLDLAASTDKKEDDITKSAKITAMLEKIEEEYVERGVYNKMYETSDGSQVIRIDVRSVRALQKIEEALQEVDCPPLVNIVSLSTRYSCKKNGKKKGFNLFLKFENDSQRTFARYILESYCYEEKLWIVKNIPPKVLRVASDQEESRAEESIPSVESQQIAESGCDTQRDVQQREA